MNAVKLPMCVKDEKRELDGHGRSVHFDIMRTLCVLVWVVRHGDSRFNETNIIFAQNWAAPLLWLISGMCWGRSRTSLWKYICRLVIVFCFGAAFNALAWKIQHKDGNVDLWNIVFHMWFVVGLMIVTCITAPYKAFCDENSTPQWNAILWSVASPFILACGAGAIYFTDLSALGMVGKLQGLTWWLHGDSRTLCLPLAESAFAQFLAVFALACKRASGIFTWVLLAYILGILVVYQHSRAGMELAAMNLFVLGVVVERLGLWGQQAVRKLITGYWLFLLLICAWLAIPLVRGATDYNPAARLVIRAQWSVITGIMLVAFLCAGDSIQDPLKIYTRFPGLKYWVVFLYVSHIAIHKLVPSPFNWWVLAASVLPFLFMRTFRDDANLEEIKPILKQGG